MDWHLNKLCKGKNEFLVDEFQVFSPNPFSFFFCVCCRFINLEDLGHARSLLGDNSS